MYLRDPQIAFDEAIASGLLSDGEAAENYAGNYMYMFTDAEGVDQFKHIDTRQYLSAAAAETERRVTTQKEDQAQRLVPETTYEKIARAKFDAAQFVKQARELEGLMAASDAGKVEAAMVFGGDFDEYKVKIAVQIVYEP